MADQRNGAVPYGRHWNSIQELLEWTDERRLESWAKQKSPLTDGSVLDAYQQGLPLLSPIDALPEPFDLIATRRVKRDCTVQFEGRTY